MIYLNVLLLLLLLLLLLFLMLSVTGSAYLADVYYIVGCMYHIIMVNVLTAYYN